MSVGVRVRVQDRRDTLAPARCSHVDLECFHAIGLADSA
jgi:hypothetical protein